MSVIRMGSEFLAEPGDLLGRIYGPIGLARGERPEASDEMPVHWVEFRWGFWIARTELTNAQYARFDPEHWRSESPDDDGPVVNASWEDANRYCAWLSEQSGREVRLLNESEWEAACRAGSATDFCFGNDEEGLAAYAWFDLRPRSGARAVETKCANDWGLFDLHGNAWEWCEDTWHGSYEGAPDDGAAWVDKVAPGRVRRGGCWYFPAERCRSSLRDRVDPVDCNGDLGFRPAFSAPTD